MMRTFKQLIAGIAAATSIAVLAPGFAVAISAQRGESAPSRPDSPAVQAWLNVAATLAGHDLDNTMTEYLCANANTKRLLLDQWFGPAGTRGRPIQMVKAFDNLYYFAWGNVTALALVTNAGIIQFDALSSDEAAQKVLLEGYRKFGLDPAQIKYVVVTHSHVDHYGGARLLQENYKARVVMGAADWDAVEQPAPPGARTARTPARDIIVTSQQEIVLGDARVTVVATPGHTLGSLSLLIPVRDRGERHVMSFWGGTDFANSGLTPTATSGGLLTHIESLRRFTAAGTSAGADGILSNHQVFDSSLTVGRTMGKAELIQKRKAGDPNPWVIGKDGFIRAMAIHEACMQAARTRVQEGYR